MLLVGATFLFFVWIFPRQRKRIKILFLIMPNTFSYIHRFRVAFVRIWKNFFVCSFSILFRVHYFSIIIFILGTLCSDQCRMPGLLIISKMRICNRYRLCDGIFLFLSDNITFFPDIRKLLEKPFPDKVSKDQKIDHDENCNKRRRFVFNVVKKISEFI